MARAMLPSRAASCRRAGPAAHPACHVYEADGRLYAYDLNTQSLLQIESALAELLRTGRSDSADAHAALRRARQEGLLLDRRPVLVPRPAPDPAEVDRDLQHLVLTVTDRCNLRCSYCLHGAGLDWMRPHGTRRMTVGTALRVADYYLERRDRTRPPAISFYGGEPLLGREVIEAVAGRVRAAEGGDTAILAIDTNGLELDDAAIDMVLRHRLHLQVSLDGPREVHDRWRRDARGRPTFDRICANLGRLLDRDPDVARRIRFIATLAPPVDLAAVEAFFGDFRLYRERGIERRPAVAVNFAYLQGVPWPAGLRARHGLPPVADQLDRARSAYLEALRQGRRREVGPVLRSLFEPGLIRLHHRSRTRPGDRFTPGANCRPGRRKLHVTPEGRLQPCERVGRDTIIGSIDEGIRPAEVAALQDRFHDAVSARCATCWALRLCGVCFAAGGAGMDASVCDRARRQTERNLALLARILEMPTERRDWLDHTSLT